MVINEKYLTEIDLYFKSDLDDCDIESFIDRDGSFVYKYKQFDDSDNVYLINSFDNNIKINYHSCCIKTHFKDLTLEQKKSLYDKFYGTTFLLETKTNKMIFESSPMSFDKFVSIIESNSNDDIFVDMNCKIQKLYEYMFNFEAFSQETFDIDSLQNPYENDSNDLIIEEHCRIDFFDKDINEMMKHKKDFCSIFNHELTHIAPQWTKNEINPLSTNKSDTTNNEYLNDDILKKKYGGLFYIMNPHEQNAFITETQQFIIDTSDDEYENLKKMAIDDIIEYTKAHSRLYRFRNYYKIFSNIDNNSHTAKMIILYVGYVFKYHELISSIKFDWLDEDVYKSIYINMARDIDGYKIQQLVSDITKQIKTVMENYERRLHHHIAYALYKRKNKQI